jgi:hypothetical protein
MSTTNQKYKSKMFRVATEGATTDGRVIAREWLTQMATAYDPKKYGARIWLEHIRGIVPDSPFRAYGDVLALETQEVEDGKLALFASIEPTPDLVALTKAKQKIYTSIEINEKFADTGAAYLVGLGITDSPASLGTEILAFSAQNPTASPYAGRKHDAGNLFTAAIESTIEFEPAGESITERLRGMFKKKPAAAADADTADIAAGLQIVADQLAQHEERFATAPTGDQVTKLAAAVTALTEKVDGFAQKIDHTEQPGARPPLVTGGAGLALTDF